MPMTHWVMLWMIVAVAFYLRWHQRRQRRQRNEAARRQRAYELDYHLRCDIRLDGTAHHPARCDAAKSNWN